MKVHKKISVLIGLVLVVIMLVPIAVVAAEENVDDNFTMMTPEELSVYLLDMDAGFNPMEITEIMGTGVIAKSLTVSIKHNLGKVAVTYYTKASSIANRVGIKDLKLYEGSGTVWTEIRDTTDFDIFTQEYSSGYYYNNPTSGMFYYAEGDHYCVFGTTMYEKHNSTPAFQY
jgi:hypothetical protein